MVYIVGKKGVLIAPLGLEVCAACGGDCRNLIANWLRDVMARDDWLGCIRINDKSILAVGAISQPITMFAIRSVLQD